MVRAVMPCVMALRLRGPFPSRFSARCSSGHCGGWLRSVLRWPRCKFSGWDRPRKRRGVLLRDQSLLPLVDALSLYDLSGAGQSCSDLPRVEIFSEQFLAMVS